MGLIQSQHNGHFLTFSEDKHTYTLDGSKVPGVTTYIHSSYPTSFGLISWMKGQAATEALKLGFEQGLTGIPFTKPQQETAIKSAKAADKKKSDEAAAVGTLTHDFAFYTETHNTEKVNETLRLINAHQDKDKIMGCVDQFRKWKSTNEDEMVASEAIIASVAHQFGGKFDRLAKRNGRLILGDFKTSSAMYLEQMVQLGAYSIAIEEWMGLKVEAFEILRFGKDDAEFQTLFVDKPEELELFREQARRCRATYEFAKLGNDPRWSWGGKEKKNKK